MLNGNTKAVGCCKPLALDYKKNINKIEYSFDKAI